MPRRKTGGSPKSWEAEAAPAILASGAGMDACLSRAVSGIGRKHLAGRGQAFWDLPSSSTRTRLVRCVTSPSASASAAASAASRAGNARLAAKAATARLSMPGRAAWPSAIQVAVTAIPERRAAIVATGAETGAAAAWGERSPLSAASSFS
jgi:hypothetical protein